MDQNNRPRGREKNVTGTGKGVERKGSGLGTGPVGGSGGNIFGRGQQSSSGQRPASQSQSGRGGGYEEDYGGRRSTRASGGRRSLLPIIVIVVLVIFFMRNGGLGNLGGVDLDSSYSSGDSVPAATSAPDYSSLLPGGSGSSSSSQASGFTGWSSGSTGWSASSNAGKLDRSVDPAARDKFTQIRGGGKDTVTIMVYMCGTDLESRSRMATKDLIEMQNATIGDKVNLIVFTGGCSAWQNSVISSNYNQIYQIKSGGLQCLKSQFGTGSMTDPKTLQGFLEFCRDNYPANRYELILWDHGGGSLSGYGYDQKHPNSGSMSLASMESALKAVGMTYDFVGFDACLMATVETAQMLSRYADYLIASEETEPGIGWYYTDWLTKLSADPSMSTLDIGKQIVDDFVTKCSEQCSGQSTTLSVVDLAELSATLPDDLSAFSQSLKALITDGDYKTVSTARSESREFAASTVIDQVDFVDFAQRLGTDEGQALAKVLLSAVKYNRTSSRMTNAYGLSVYFPMRKLSSVSTAVKTYDALGMDDDFTDCIREYASMQTSGQVASSASGYATNPYAALFGGTPSSATSSSQSAVDIADLLSVFLGGGSSGFDSSYFTGRSLASVEATAQYLADNRFDPAGLFWQLDAQGNYFLSLSEEQWSLVRGLDMNLFYDDGEGYVDLGYDNLFSFDSQGRLIPDTEGTWLSINDQPVAYYHTDTTEDGSSCTMSGRVPALLTRKGESKAELVDLIVIFNDENPKGYVAGAQPVYADDVTETVARGLIELSDGDRLQFVCDFYSYGGDYQDSYALGDPITVSGALTISDTYLPAGSKLLVFYRFTDIYDQTFWSRPITLG